MALQSRLANEVLVIVRDTDTETAAVLSDFYRELSTIRGIRVTEPGLIAALNCGLDHAEGDLLVFTDDDSEAQADWLEQIHSSFSVPSTGAVGGRDWLQLPAEYSKFRPAEVTRVGALSWYGKQYGNHHCPLRGHRKKVMFLKGVNMAFRQSALGSYRIDTRLRGTGAQAGSEIDLCLQVKRSGFDVVFDDRILVKHYCAPRTAGDCRTDLTGPFFADMCFNNHYLIAKHFSLFRSLAYFCNERFLGSRSVPGLLAFVKWRLRSDRLIWGRTMQMAQVGLAGMVSGRRARATTPQHSADLHVTESAA